MDATDGAGTTPPGDVHGVPGPHPDLGGLSGLVGTWAGTGRGDYPTIAPFEYREEVVFAHVGKPFLAYTQRTWHATTGAPLHAESGYLRPGAGGVVELVVAQPTGLVEILTGELAADADDPDARWLRLSCEDVQRTPSALPVRATRRALRWDGDRLTYDLWMAHAQTPMSHHLHAELGRRVGETASG